MKDSYGRNIDYLRISIIDKCNLRCQYCHDGSYAKMPYDSIIKYEEILQLTAHLRTRGLKSVKITGGEPLIRRDLPFLIKGLVEQDLEVSLTTNGVLLSKKAQTLFDAGLKRINIGVDCLEKKQFESITGFDQLDAVKDGIKKAIDVGFSPVKVNVVLIEGLNDNFEPWIEFAKNNKVVVRFIEVMPFVNGFKPLKNSTVKDALKQNHKLEDVTVAGTGPAKHYGIEGFKGIIGFISSQSESYCENCNRIRLNAQGKLRGCLFDVNTFDYLKLARNGYSTQKLDNLIDMLLCHKPQSKEGLEPVENMCQIGG